MADKRASKAPPLGVYDQPAGHGLGAGEIIGIVLSVLWMVGAGVFFLGMGGAAAIDGEAIDQLRFTMVLLAVFVPVAVIWVAAAASRSARIMREESRRLQAAVDAMRQTYVASQQGGLSTVQPSVERKLEEIVTAAKQTETAVATFATTREAPPTRTAPQPPAGDGATAADQPGLALGTPPEALEPPLERSDFIRALNFPENAEDKEGFAALRRALKDRKTAELVNASQDILTLLSQDGIYMDDLRPDPAKPEVWRQFVAGERGRQVAAMGGIRDRSSLALTAGRMRSDPVFRDTSHHFLRRFDQALVEFEATATDEDLAQLSSTRTARAFMLLGRVTGAFG